MKRFRYGPDLQAEAPEHLSQEVRCMECGVAETLKLDIYLTIGVFISYFTGQMDCQC